MAHARWHERRPPHGGRPARTAVGEQREALALVLDLRRADLYRILDAFARAPPEGREAIEREFEQAWKDFKVALAKTG